MTVGQAHRGPGRTRESHGDARAADCHHDRGRAGDADADVPVRIDERTVQDLAPGDGDDQATRGPAGRLCCRARRREGAGWCPGRRWAAGRQRGRGIHAGRPGARCPAAPVRAVEVSWSWCGCWCCASVSVPQLPGCGLRAGLPLLGGAADCCRGVVGCCRAGWRRIVSLVAGR